MPYDTSSTMRYSRDTFPDFIRYWLRFMFLGLHDILLYLVPRKRKKMYTKITLSEVCYVVAVIGLCFLNLKATLVVFIVPFVFARFVMMAGNWAQHAFVDPDEPDNDFASNIICLNTSYNHKCWNDGYHAIHHIRPGAHYTEMPVLFQQMLPNFETNKTFIFEKIHFLHIFIYLMLKRYDKLADNLVSVHGNFTDKEDAIDLLRSRTRKFDLKMLREKVG